MRLSEYVDNCKDDMKEQKFEKNVQNTQADVEVSKEELSKMYDNMKDMSQDELMERLKSEIKRQKKDGSFDYDALISSLNAIKDFLPKENYDNMIRIIDGLNGKNW
mgnify:CR=1 FL=1